MNWQAFKEALLQHQHLDLQFEYEKGKWVNASYHITEIKQAPIVSVDCGGMMNSWTEIVIQLLEPETGTRLRAMKVKKALSIIELVEKALALDPLATVKIEFGNAAFDTRQMLTGNIVVEAGNLVVCLRPDTVQCKANERGGSCGPAAKPKIELKNLAVAPSCCEPGRGCC